MLGPGQGPSLPEMHKIKIVLTCKKNFDPKSSLERPVLQKYLLCNFLKNFRSRPKRRIYTRAELEAQRAVVRSVYKKYQSTK